MATQRGPGHMRVPVHYCQNALEETEQGPHLSDGALICGSRDKDKVRLKEVLSWPNLARYN
jgi:hypothetical protein